MRPQVSEGPTRPTSVFHSETSEYNIPTLADIKVMQREKLDTQNEVEDLEVRSVTFTLNHGLLGCCMPGWWYRQLYCVFFVCLVTD